MNKTCYINGISSISAQPKEVPFFTEPIEYHQNIIPACYPVFKDFISPKQLRRMSYAVRMGLVSAKQALTEATLAIPDAIITGSGEGCKQDTEKFLEKMLDDDEQFLTPTSFIQSTHNTVGGQIALYLKCTGYNVTYTQNAASFESALMDAQLLFEEEELKNCLLGGVEELAKTSTGFYFLDGQLKTEPLSNLKLLQSKTPGSITSEGAQFFVLSSEKSRKTYAIFKDVKIINTISPDEISKKITTFLADNYLEISNLDMVILGNNGDVKFNEFYRILQQGIFKEIPQLGYKHLVGDYNSVSGYAFWLACQILKDKKVPEILKINDIPPRKPKNVLLYNQYLGKNHGLILLQQI